MTQETDRELLELAANAAGYDYECTSHTGRPENDQHQIRDWFGMLVDWNPLTDDGDALRLAVNLKILVDIGIDSSEATNGDYICLDISELHRNSDHYAATRRAIVRAAAAIGKTK